MGSKNPYAPPVTDEAVPGAPVEGTAVYLPLGRRAAVARGFLFGCATSAVLTIVSQLVLLRLLLRAPGPLATQDQSYDLRQTVIDVVYVAALVGATISFCVWIYRAHKNLPAVGATDLKYSPGWTVGAFFVPVLNLWRPCQIMLEIWRASDPRGNPAASIVGWWWALWVVDNLASGIIAKMPTATIGDQISVIWVVVFAHGVDIAAALLAAAIVKGVGARQEAAVRAAHG